MTRGGMPRYGVGGAGTERRRGSERSLPRLHTRFTWSRSRWSSVSDRMRLGERLPDGRRRGRALGVAEPARAHTVRDVVDDVVVLAIVRHTGRHVVELEGKAHLPGDVVVGAGGVATHAEAADELPIGIVERQAAAEHV